MRNLIRLDFFPDWHIAPSDSLLLSILCLVGSWCPIGFCRWCQRRHRLPVRLPFWSESKLIIEPAFNLFIARPRISRFCRRRKERNKFKFLISIIPPASPCCSWLTDGGGLFPTVSLSSVSSLLSSVLSSAENRSNELNATATNSNYSNLSEAISHRILSPLLALSSRSGDTYDSKLCASSSLTLELL